MKKLFSSFHDFCAKFLLFCFFLILISCESLPEPSTDSEPLPEEQKTEELLPPEPNLPQKETDTSAQDDSTVPVEWLDNSETPSDVTTNEPPKEDTSSGSLPLDEPAITFAEELSDPDVATTDTNLSEKPSDSRSSLAEWNDSFVTDSSLKENKPAISDLSETQSLRKDTDILSSLEDFMPPESSTTFNDSLEEFSQQNTAGLSELASESVPEIWIPEEKSWMDEETTAGIWEYENGGILIPAEDKKEDVADFRNVTVAKGQKLDLKLPGLGWVFVSSRGKNSQGKDSTQVFDFKGKRVEDGKTVFSFLARDIGNAELSFSRFDVLNDSYTDFKILAFSEDSNKAGTVIWDSFAILPKEIEMPPLDKETSTTQENNNSYDSTSQTQKLTEKKSLSKNENSSSLYNSVAEEPTLELVEKTSERLEPTSKKAYAKLSSQELLDFASDSLKNGEVQDSLEMLEYYVTAFSDSLDKVWFLLGQAYEAASPQKNIKAARSAYQKVVDAFPFSSLWQSAKDRIAYINRFYFNVR